MKSIVEKFLASKVENVKDFIGDQFGTFQRCKIANFKAVKF